MGYFKNFTQEEKESFQKAMVILGLMRHVSNNMRHEHYDERNGMLNFSYDTRKGTVYYDCKIIPTGDTYSIVIYRIHNMIRMTFLAEKHNVEPEELSHTFINIIYDLPTKFDDENFMKIDDFYKDYLSKFY